MCVPIVVVAQESAPASAVCNRVLIGVALKLGIAYTARIVQGTIYGNPVALCNLLGVSLDHLPPLGVVLGLGGYRDNNLSGHRAVLSVFGFFGLLP